MIVDREAGYESHSEQSPVSLNNQEKEGQNNDG
jgi:hypothetical protein